jgi:hypothetical protein
MRPLEIQVSSELMRDSTVVHRDLQGVYKEDTFQVSDCGNSES